MRDLCECVCTDFIVRSYANIFLFALVAGFVDVPTVPHGIAVVLALNIVREKPQLTCANEVVGNLGAGDFR